MQRRECSTSTNVEMKKLTSGPEFSDIDRIMGQVSLLQAQSVADSCYDAQPSDKPSDVAKPSGPFDAKEFALHEPFIAPYKSSRRSPTSEATTLLSVILLGAAVVCFWRAAAGAN